MADRLFRYFKVVVENNLISKNKWLIMWLLVGGGVAGNVGQVTNNWDKDNQISSAVHTIKVLNDYYVKPTIKPAIPAKPTINIGRVMRGCKAECQKILNQHEEGKGGWH